MHKIVIFVNRVPETGHLNLQRIFVADMFAISQFLNALALVLSAKDLLNFR